MVAAHQRRLRPGSEYARYFTLKGLEKSDPVLANGDTFETIRQMDKWIRHYQSDTAEIAPVLRGPSLLATCRNIWEFAYNHFQYKLDKDGVEQLRRPLRSWADRRSGIDCDCYSILISSILLNLRIPHKLRKTKYNNKPDYQHIYVIVPTSGGQYITIDPVVDAFNQEVPYTGKFDHDMTIQGLNGIAEAPSAARLAVRGAVPLPAATLSGASGGARLPFGAEFLPLQQRASQVLGLGRVAVEAPAVEATTVAEVAAVLNATPAEAAVHIAEVQRISLDLLDGIRQNLVNTRAQILATKEASLYDLAEKIAAVLAVWDRPAERDALIAQFSSGRTYENMTSLGVPMPAKMASLGGNWFSDAVDSVGDFFGDVGHAIGQAGSWIGQQVSTAAHAVGQAASWVGNGVANGASAAWGGVKQAAGWIADQAVKIGKLILKYNPFSIIIRAALRIAFRVNLFYMSERLAIGYASDAQAQAAKLNESEFRKAQDRLSSVQSMWRALQGDADILRSDIMRGNANASNPAKIPGLSGLSGISGTSLGVVGADDAAGTAAASGFIATIVQWLKSVDWKKLFATISTVASTAKALVNKYLKTPTPGQDYQAPTSEQEYYANQRKYDNPPQSNNVPLIIAGLGAAYLILAR